MFSEKASGIQGAGREVVERNSSRSNTPGQLDFGSCPKTNISVGREELASEAVMGNVRIRVLFRLGSRPFVGQYCDRRVAYHRGSDLVRRSSESLTRAKNT